MNYFPRLIREMNVMYKGDNTPFLTREETEKVMVIFHGLLMYIIHNCHFQVNINARYQINKIMDYLEINPELWIKYRVSKKGNKNLNNLFSKDINE